MSEESLENKVSENAVDGVENSNSAEVIPEPAPISNLIKSILAFLAIALMLRGTFLEAFKIPSGSMLETLQEGDYLVVNKLSYNFWLPWLRKSAFNFAEPKRGDVVVFTLPDDPSTEDKNEADINIIKRIIAVGGDTVEVKGTKVYLNDVLQSESYAMYLQGGARDFPKYTIPEKSVFLLGDNRDNSRDARFWDVHHLEIDRIKGRALFIYFNMVFDFSRFFKAIK